MIAQSGVQHPIFSCSGAMPISAPVIEHPAEDAAKAGPGLSASESATSRARTSLIEARQCSRSRFESMDGTRLQLRTEVRLAPRRLDSTRRNAAGYSALHMPRARS